MQQRIAVSDAARQKIGNMGLLCAMLVVSIHVVWPHDMPMSFGWFIHQCVKQGIARIAVPFFFIVSGFLLSRHFYEHGWWGREISKRVSSLVVPFVFWSLAYVAATIPLSAIADQATRCLFGINAIFHFPYCVMGFDLTDNPLLVPLWYVRCLFLFVLTAPAFKLAVFRLGIVWLMCAFLLLLIVEDLQNETWRTLFSRGYSALGAFYFSVGIYVQRIKPKSLPPWVAIVCAITGLALLAGRIAVECNGWNCGSVLHNLSLPFLIYAVWHGAGVVRLPGWLVRCSFPIFLMHFIVLAYFWVIGSRLTLNGMAFPMISYAGSILVSIAAALLLRRFAPKLAGIIFGGR